MLIFRSYQAGMYLFILNFIGLMLMNGSGEFLSLLLRHWKGFRRNSGQWKSIKSQFWQCIPFKLVMPFQTEFLIPENSSRKCHVSTIKYYFSLIIEVLVPILLPIGSFTFVMFLTIGSFGCSVRDENSNENFLIGDKAFGLFDSKTVDDQIGSKISILSGEFSRQFRLPGDQQTYYCYTSSPLKSVLQNFTRTDHQNHENIFEILLFLQVVDESLFEEYLNCIGHAFQVSQDRIIFAIVYFW